MISVCMAYHNRLAQLQATLASIGFSDVTASAVIFDDASDGWQALTQDWIHSHRRQLKSLIVERVHDKAVKTWANPGVPFNRAVSLAITTLSPDIVVIQNPECAHVGDVLGDIQKRIRPGKWLSYAAYNATKDASEQVCGDVFVGVPPKPRTLPRRSSGWYDEGWYNHSVHRPTGYHFCAAIMREDWERIGGFNEKYADGLWYEDDELLLRLKVAGIEVEIVDEPFVVHQWHEKSHAVPGCEDLIRRNQERFIADKERFRLGTLPADWRQG